MQLKIENQKLTEKVANHASEMEKYRKESSNLESKIVMIQQDRTEIHVNYLKTFINLKLV